MSKIKFTKAFCWAKAAMIAFWGFLPGCGDDEPVKKDAVQALKKSGLIQKSYSVSKEAGQVCGSCGRK